MRLTQIMYGALLFSLILISCKKEKEVIIEQPEEKPVAAFDFELVDPLDPFTYRFNNKSDNFKQVLWSFADDSTSSDLSPVHTFLKAGIYKVNLVVTNGDGYWAQRVEPVEIVAKDLITIKTVRLGAGKLQLAYDITMDVAKTEWIDGYVSSSKVFSEEEETVMQFENGQFKEIRLRLTSQKGSIIQLDALVSELGVIKDLTNVDNEFKVSHENSNGPTHKEASKSMVDNNIETKFFVGNVGGNLSWQFEFFEPQIINGYRFTSGNDADARDPQDWRIEASMDGQTWDVVDERTGFSFTPNKRKETISFLFENNTPYKYYKFYITKLKSGNHFQLSELRLFEVPQ